MVKRRYDVRCKCNKENKDIKKEVYGFNYHAEEKKKKNCYVRRARNLL